MIIDDKLYQRFSQKYKINAKTRCWEWMKSLDNGGYGRFLYNGKDRKSHRVSMILHHKMEQYEFENRKILVCHHCDNPKCVNPDHLFLGSHQDNKDDSVNKGRSKRFQHGTSKMYGHGCRCELCVLENKKRVKILYNKSDKIKESSKRYYIENQNKIRERSYIRYHTKVKKCTLQSRIIQYKSIY